MIERGKRMMRLKWLLGDEIDRRHPLIAATFTYALFSTFWVYVGVFGVKGLGAVTTAVGFLFLATAPAAALANYLSGTVSDRLGRRGLIIASLAASAANMTVLWLIGKQLTTPPSGAVHEACFRLGDAAVGRALRARVGFMDRSTTPASIRSHTPPPRAVQEACFRLQSW
jgi:MFS family permease